jgi:hypothetical protein
MAGPRRGEGKAYDPKAALEELGESRQLSST